MKKQTKRICYDLYRKYLTLHTVEQAITSNHKAYYIARLIIPKILK